MRLSLVFLFPLIIFTLSIPPSTQQAHAGKSTKAPAKKSFNPELSGVPVYGYQIVNTFPHDPGAFTQGLLYHAGRLYESTGLHGASSLRIVALETGTVLKRRDLPEQYFTEGLALCGNRLIQLTYQSRVGFIYDLDLSPAGAFDYPTEGWGLTCDGRRLILSDGTATLRWLDAKTFKVIRQVTVTDRGELVERLNELEFVKGEIFANVWQTDRIARISPDTGQVTGWIDLAGLAQRVQASAAAAAASGSGKDPKSVPGIAMDVLNGIAYDAQGDRLFVTGKFWPKLFEIKLVR